MISLILNFYSKRECVSIIHTLLLVSNVTTSFALGSSEIFILINVFLSSVWKIPFYGLIWNIQGMLATCRTRLHCAAAHQEESLLFLRAEVAAWEDLSQGC